MLKDASYRIIANIAYKTIHLIYSRTAPLNFNFLPPERRVTIFVMSKITWISLIELIKHNKKRDRSFVAAKSFSFWECKCVQPISQ